MLKEGKKVNFNQYFKEKKERIELNLERGNLGECVKDIDDIKLQVKLEYYFKKTATMIIAPFASLICGVFLPKAYAGHKAGNSQELADRLSEYASSQGFDDYQKFVDDVNANVTTRTNGGFFNRSTEYVYSSPKYEDWFNNITIINDNVTKEFTDNMMANFYGCGAGVAVVMACFMPCIVTLLKEHHYNIVIKAMQNELDEKANCNAKNSEAPMYAQ